MSVRKQGKNNKRRFHEQVDGSEGKKKHLNLSLCEVESKSSSCGSKNSHIKITNRKKEKDKCDNFFIVDKIVGHKICHGKSYFKVQWQGYNESEDSWEPEENLSNVMDLIEEFRSNKISDNKSEDNRSNNNINRSRNSGCYEYVPSNKVVAMKTKYFDDIRDGKIDLTKNDLYSRVKTRKRLHLDESLEKTAENSENISQDLTVEESVEIAEIIVKPEEVQNSFEKTKFYQTNLFEMSAEFMKSGSFKKSQNTIASKSSSNDDISLFNYSISPNTNQSDEFAVQISPHINNIVESTKQSVYTQTISLDFENKEFAQKEITQTPTSECHVSIKPHIQKIIDKIDESIEKPSTGKLVTNETDLLNIYAKNIRQTSVLCLNLPKIQAESDLISIDNFDDLKCSILMDKYHLLHNTLQNGTCFDWNEKFLPEYLTPLQLAISKNRVNIVRLLLRYGAPPDFTDNLDNEETPLMLASSLGYVHAVKALLDHGAFTDCRIKTRTALYFAIENGRVDVVSMLLKFGTNFYRIAENLSSSSLINDLFMTNRLSNVVCVDLLALIRNYHMSFINSLNRTITRYFTKHFIKQICIIFPPQWVSVLEKQFNTDFLLDSSVMTNIDTPILLLVHGIQADYNIEFWLDNNCCCIESVFVNDTRQSSLSTSSFSTTLWPLNASINKLTVNFVDQELMSPEEKQIRIAIVAVSIDCNRTTNNNNRNLTSTFTQIAHSRNYHRNTD